MVEIDLFFSLVYRIFYFQQLLHKIIFNVKPGDYYLIAKYLSLKQPFKNMVLLYQDTIFIKASKIAQSETASEVQFF